MMDFNRYIGFVTLGLVLAMGMLQPAQAAFPSKYNPGHYMRYAYEPGKTSNTEFGIIQNIPQFLGVQIRYAWKDLEPRRGVYNFAAIEAHLNYLKNMPTPKRLIIEILDNGPHRTAQDETRVPDYLRTAEFENGIFKTLRGNVSTKRWNTNVQTRQIALFKALGARFDKDPYLEGVVLGETATGISPSEWSQATYTAEKQYAGLRRIMLGLKNAFPNTMCIQWINYFNGANSQDTAAKIAGLTQYAFQIGSGFGGPAVDLRAAIPSYPHYGKYSGSLPLVNGVEWDDWETVNPATGQLPTAVELLGFAKSKLHATHLSWSKKEPQFTNQVIPLITKAAGAL